jgi:predicted XRE-type DNA-binding protein
MAKVKGDDTIEPSSGNVFADLGLPDAVELDTKLRLAVSVNRQLRARQLTRAAAAAALSINQPKVSESLSVEPLQAGWLLNGATDDISHSPGK